MKLLALIAALVAQNAVAEGAGHLQSHRSLVKAAAAHQNWLHASRSHRSLVKGAVGSLAWIDIATDPSNEDPNLNPSTPCEGTGDFSSTLPACYGGSVMSGLEIFSINIQSFQKNKGLADFIATGAMEAERRGMGIVKEGQEIKTETDLKAAFQGQVEISKIEYCSSADQLRVTVASPMALTVALDRINCAEALSLAQQSPEDITLEASLPFAESDERIDVVPPKAGEPEDVALDASLPYAESDKNIDVVPSAASSGAALPYIESDERPENVVLDASLPYAEADQRIDVGYPPGAFPAGLDPALPYAESDERIDVTVPENPLDVALDASLPYAEADQRIDVGYPPGAAPAGLDPALPYAESDERIDVTVPSAENPLDVALDASLPLDPALPYAESDERIDVTVPSTENPEDEGGSLEDAAYVDTVKAQEAKAAALQQWGPSSEVIVDKDDDAQPCVGDGDFKGNHVCFAASVAGGGQKFFISVRNYQHGKGQVDVVASGLVSGTALGEPFTKTGQALHAPGVVAAMAEKVTIDRVEYCSTKNYIQVYATKPMHGAVVLWPSPCIM